METRRGGGKSAWVNEEDVNWGSGVRVEELGHGAVVPRVGPGVFVPAKFRRTDGPLLERRAARVDQFERGRYREHVGRNRLGLLAGFKLDRHRNAQRHARFVV